MVYICSTTWHAEQVIFAGALLAASQLIVEDKVRYVAQTFVKHIYMLHMIIIIMILPHHEWYLIDPQNNTQKNNPQPSHLKHARLNPMPVPYLQYM